MAKPNYAFAKRQRELAKKQKKEEKAKRKSEASAAPETSEERELPVEDTQSRPPDGEGRTD